MKPIFKKFNDLKAKDINFDFHIHTNQTDGTSTPEEIIRKAIELKLKAIAFTEHVNKNSDWFDDFAVEIDALRNNKKIRIYLGIEAKALDFNGTLDAAGEMIDKSDIVIGVVHRYPNKEKKFLVQAKATETEFNLAMGLLKNKSVDVLGHPFGVYSMFYRKIPINYMKQLLIESIKRGKAVEINTKYIVDKNLFFKLLKKINPYVSIGSDAHSERELAKDFTFIRLNVNKI
ncbi:MAG: putative hydrolase [Parcubacteria group bacterium Licking1014_1]|nr:MAG: putative hydrolase [Parcubacteria group bacterium Licking1014_1]